MKIRSLVITTVLFISLVGVYVYLDKTGAKHQEEKKKESVVANFDKTKLNEIRLVRTGEVIHLKKQETGSWAMDLPYNAKGDVSVIDSIISYLEKMSFTSTLEGIQNLKAYGLENPRLMIELGFTDGTKKSFKIGEDTPIEYSLYLQKDDDKNIMLVEKGAFTSLNNNVKQLRDKNIFHLENTELKNITLSYPKGKSLHLVKSEDNKWKLSLHGKKWDVDTAKFTELKRAISEMKALDFVSEKGESELKKYGFDYPTVTVSVTVDVEKPQSQQVAFSLGTKDKKYYLKRKNEPSIYDIGETAFNFFKQTEFSIRDKRLVVFAKDDIKRVVLEVKKSQILLDKTTPADWVIASLGNAKAKSEKVDDMLRNIRDAQTKEFVNDAPSEADLKKYGLANPIVKMELSSPTISISFGAVKGDKVYVMDNSSRSVVFWDKSIFDKLPQYVNALIFEDKKEPKPTEKK